MGNQISQSLDKEWKVMVKIICSIFIAILLTGCTTNATRQAIEQYHATEAHKQLAADNALRMANEQMLLNLTQYVEAHPEQAVQAIKATWKARNELEKVRIQFIYARSQTMLTVGQYLYDQQGWLNVLIESNSKDLGRTMDAVDAGNKAAGITDVTELVKPTTRPSLGTLLEDLDK